MLMQVSFRFISILKSLFVATLEIMGPRLELLGKRVNEEGSKLILT
jgi:hypothetical protein